MRSRDKLKKKFMSINMTMVINVGRIGIYDEEFPSIKSPDHLITWTCKGVKKCFSCCVTTTTRLMATKLGKVEAYI